MCENCCSIFFKCFRKKSGENEGERQSLVTSGKKTTTQRPQLSIDAKQAQKLKTYGDVENPTPPDSAAATPPDHVYSLLV